MKNDKLKIQFVHVKEHPAMIIGQNPGHEKDWSHTGVVWQKNKSAKLLWEALEDRQNVILTNICNYTIITPQRLSEGVIDIYTLIKTYHPKKIICLGNIAYSEVKKMEVQNMPKVYHFQHPSYIIRFNKAKEQWKRILRESLDD